MGCSDCCDGCFETKPGCPACTTHWVPGCLKVLSFITCQCIKPAKLEDGEENDAKCCPSCCCSCCTCKRSWSNCCIVMLYITIVLSVLLVIAISVYPTTTFIVGWAKCTPHEYSTSQGRICFTIEIDETTGPDIVLRDSEEMLINDNNTHEVQEFADLTKIAILFSTTANGVSQLLFILALVCLFCRHYKCSCENCECIWSCWKGFKLCCCCIRDEADDKSILPLDPFNDDHENEFIEPTSIAVVYQYNLEQVIILDQQQGDQQQGDQQEGDQNKQGNFFFEQDTSTSTLLQGERLCHYNTWFGIGSFMMIAVGLTFFLVQYKYNQTTTDQWELSTTICYAWSLIRTIVSCFIFSKLMYAIQRKCEEIEMYVCYTNDNIKETVEANDKIKEYVKARFKSQLKIAATEMLKFVKSSGADIPILAGKLADGFLKEFKDNADVNEVDASSNQIKEAIKTRINFSGKKYTKINDTCYNNTYLKKIEEYVIAGINSVAYNDIKEQDYITQDKRIKAQGDSYAYAMKELIKRHIKVTQDNDDGKKELALKYLKERDKHFVKTAVVTLSWLQLWFLLHWLLHILSTFMIFTVLIDAVALHVKEKLNHIEEGVGFHPVQIVFLCLYSLVQCFVLVYPCLRAAGVTRTRQRVIRKISDEAYKFTNLPQGVIPEFIESMKRRKFGFRFRILCASITFNLNIAYLSIAFGFVGIVVSLITSVTS